IIGLPANGWSTSHSHEANGHPHGGGRSYIQLARLKSGFVARRRRVLEVFPDRLRRLPSTVKERQVSLDAPVPLVIVAAERAVTDHLHKLPGDPRPELLAGALADLVEGVGDPHGRGLVHPALHGHGVKG